MILFKITAVCHVQFFFTLDYFKALPNRLWKAFCSEQAEVEVRAIIGGVLLLCAYLASPEMFHHFIRYLIDMVFDALHSAFGTEKSNSDLGSSNNGSGGVKGGNVTLPSPENHPGKKN